MKKMVAILIVCTVLLGSVFADFTFGVKAGGGLTNPSQIIWDEWGFPEEFQKNTFSFIGGVSVNYTINDVFSIESGLFYSPKSINIDYGYEISHDWDNQHVYYTYTYEFEMKMSYLEIPVLLKMNTGALTPYAGVSTAILLSNDGIILKGTSNEYDTDGNLIYDYSWDESSSDIKDCLSSIVLNAQFGIQYKLTDTIVLDLRYVMGLTSIEKYYEITESEYTRLAGLTSDERTKWYNEHPFRYETREKSVKDNESIFLNSLYLLVGYQF